MSKFKITVLSVFGVYLIGCVFCNVSDIANNLKYEYEVVQHNPSFVAQMQQVFSYYAKITLTNTGNIPITPGDWSLVFCHNGLPASARFNPRTSQYADGTSRGNMTLKYLKGCLYELSPNSDFSIPVGQSKEFIILVDGTLQAINDIYPNVYIKDSVSAAVIPNTRRVSDFLKPLDSLFQWSISPMFMLNTQTFPKLQYAVIKNDKTMAIQDTDIIPTPDVLTTSPGQIVLDGNTKIALTTDNTKLQELGATLREDLGSQAIPLQAFCTSRPCPAVESIIPNLIVLNLIQSNDDEGFGAYTFKSIPNLNRIEIKSNSYEGISNGIQTLKALAKLVDNTLIVPVVNIEDKPRYKVRGLSIDAASRHISIQDLKKLMDAMSMYKLNYLQLELANDVKFALEMDTIPELTSHGAKFCHDITESTCMLPQFGNEPGKHQYYTKEDWIDLLRHARKRQINVVPQINFDSYTKAMSYVVKEMTKSQNEKFNYNWDGIYPEGLVLPHKSRSSMVDGKMDLCSTKASDLFNELLTVLHRYYDEAGETLKSIFIGGDFETLPQEVLNYSFCVNNSDSAYPLVEAKKNFLQRITNISKSHDVKLEANAEYFTAYPTVCNPPCTATYFTPYNISKHFFTDNIRITHHDVESFRLLPIHENEAKTITDNNDVRLQTKVHRFQLNGYKSLLQPMDFFHLHHKETNEFDAPGDLNIVTPNIPLQYSIGYIPPTGTCCDSHYCPKSGILCSAEPYPDHDGIVAKLETKRLYNRNDIFKALFPRVLALAETAWKKHDWVDSYSSPELVPKDTAAHDTYVKFKTILGEKELSRLEILDIPYKMYMPAISFEGSSNQLEYAPEIPGHVIQMLTKDGNNYIWRDLNEGKNMIPSDPNAVMTFRTRSKSGRAISKEVVVQKQHENPYEAQFLELQQILNSTGILHFPIENATIQSDPTGATSYVPLSFLYPLYKHPNPMVASPMIRRDYEMYKQMEALAIQRQQQLAQYMRLRQQQQELLRQQLQQGQSSQQETQQQQLANQLRLQQQQLTQRQQQQMALMQQQQLQRQQDGKQTSATQTNNNSTNTNDVLTQARNKFASIIG